MQNKVEIIEHIHENRENLIPVKGFSIQFHFQTAQNQLGEPDFFADISFKGQKMKVAGKILPQKSFSAAQDSILQIQNFAKRDPGVVPMVIAKYLGPDKREFCQKMGVAFLDLSGNMFIEHKGIYIERIGFPNRFPEKRRARGPFSDKASMIVRVMLSERNKLWGIRELARAGGLDPGFVSRMSKELEKRHYIIRSNSKIKLQNVDAIIEDWCHAYSYKKNHAIQYFCLASDPEEIHHKIRLLDVPQDMRYALTLQAGANLVAPYSVYSDVSAYVSGEDVINYFISKLKLRKVEQGANMVFLLPFYTHSVFYGIQTVRSLRVVSDLQLYLDLYRYPIRGLEQAEHLYHKRLKEML